MLITFHCEHCNSRLRTNADAMGSALHCPECDKSIIVPQIPFGEGYVIGGFLIKEKIGQGGMGEVYLARQLSMERDIALKILPPQFTRQGNFVVRFLKEVHFQAKLDHPHIVTAYEAGEDSGVYYMAMAYVKGETLEQILERDGVMEESDALSIIEQVGEALNYAWNEQGLLHRDIKPGNIMLHKGLNAKVLDLGLSKSVHDSQGTTQADTLMGTPNYMSPEQVDTPQDVGPHSDMYALGMTLYHMLCGVIPFEDSSYMKVLQRHSAEQLEDPRHLMPGISPATTKLLTWILARDADQRPETWEAFVDAVREARSGSAASIREPDGDSTLKRDANADPAEPVKKNTLADIPRPIALGLSVLIGLIIGGIGIAYLSTSLREKKAGEDEALAAVPTPVIIAPTPTPPIVVGKEERLNRQLADALLEYEQNPESYDATITRLLELAEQAKSTALSPKVMEHYLRIREAREQAVAREREKLAWNVIQHLKEDSPENATRYLNNFESPFKEDLKSEIAKQRGRITNHLHKQERSAQEERQQALNKLLELENSIAPLLMQFELTESTLLLAEAESDPAYKDVAAELQLLIGNLDELREIPRRVIGSFIEEEGNELLVELKDGTVTLEITEVLETSMQVERKLRNNTGELFGSTEFQVTYSDLHPREVMRRLHDDQSHSAMLFKGILANQNGSTETAIHFLRAAERPFGTQMASQLEMLSVPLDLPTLDLLPDQIETNQPPKRARPRLRPIAPSKDSSE